jgi:pimeloyl-ACP methyl ester carboxylesterase
MLYFRESGDPSRPAIVLLHGGGLSSREWEPQFERLADFHLLAPDLPGHGRSTASGPFHLDDAARQVAEMIQARAPAGRAHVVGLSLGGATALTLLRIAPEVVDRPMVTGTAAGLSRALGQVSLASLWMLKLYRPEKLAELTLKQQGIPERYRSLAHDDLLAGSTAEFSANLIRELMAMRLPVSYRGPILVCVGQKETAAARQAARALARALPGARAAQVPGHGHVWDLQDPDLFAATVRAWAADQPLPAALQPLR